MAPDGDHVIELEETFKNICQTSLCLKGIKCMFGVIEGHFLRYHITLEGIKPRIDKIEVVLHLTPPKTIKEVQ